MLVNRLFVVRLRMQSRYIIRMDQALEQDLWEWIRIICDTGMTSGIYYIVLEFHYVLNSNTTLFNLDDVDASTKFNHCITIIYYAGKN